MLHIGTTLDQRYRIDYVIKQGGMGTVYGGHDLRLDRPCAVKAVPVTSAREVTQFRHEARVLGRLCHPHLPAIYDWLEEQGVVFVVMQMIPGDDLEGVTLRMGLPRWETAVNWALQLAEAVHYLHDQSPAVIHRDIKPANIRLAGHGQIYLVDFGIAKLLDGAPTVTAAKAASVPYAPIEQVQDGSHTDQQSDIYAFGATLYRIITNTLPPSCVDRLVGKEIAPIRHHNPEVPEALAALIEHCMELWNTDRPRSMAEVLRRLDELRAPGAASLAPVALPTRRSAPAPIPQRPSDPGTTAQSAFQDGKAAVERGDTAAAHTHFTAAINLARTFAEAYAERAAVHSSMGLVDAAISDWDSAIAQGQRRPAWLIQRAALYLERGDLQAAVADLTRAIELDPQQAEAYLLRAYAALAAGDLRSHLVDLDRALTLAPGHVEARAARARARVDQQLWQPALVDCNALVEASPDRPAGYLLRARVYTELGEMARAMRDLAQAVSIEPQSAEAFFLRGRLMQRSGDRQSAIRDYNTALSIDESHPEARYRRAQLLRANGAEIDAITDYHTLCQQLRSRLARQSDDEPALLTATPARRAIFDEVQYLMQHTSLERARRHVYSQVGSFRDDSDEDLEERATLFERVGLFDAALDDLDRVAKLLFQRQRAIARDQNQRVKDQGSMVGGR